MANPSLVVGIKEIKTPSGVKRGFRLCAAVFNLAKFNIFTQEYETSFAEKYLVDWRGDYTSYKEASDQLLTFVKRQKGRVEVQL